MSRESEVSEITEELCKWLRENSSGIYRPARDAADLIEAKTREIDRLQDGISRCYRMLLSEPDTRGALFKAENILRDLLQTPR